MQEIAALSQPSITCLPQANAQTKLADFEVAKRVAAEERAAHERTVAAQQAADLAMAMGLQVQLAHWSFRCVWLSNPAGVSCFCNTS